MHFLALQRSIDGVSKKMLTQTLRHLERDGLVTRRPEPHDSSVEYSLTALGQGLCGPLESLRQWSEENFAGVEQARACFDAANGARHVSDRKRRPAGGTSQRSESA
jgi:DNA-binding HxlR family transcriptional regulator